MTTRVKAYSYLLAILLGLGGSSAWPEADPGKLLLVGTWIGHVEVPRDSERVLVIRSVKAKDSGGWIADGRYGYTVEKMDVERLKSRSRAVILSWNSQREKRIRPGSNWWAKTGSKGHLMSSMAIGQVTEVLN